MDKMTIYHGSGSIIEMPELGKGNARNDYGLGFYCTQDLDLAKEWACSEEKDGFANEYTLDMEGLSLLRLNDGTYHILNWLAILLKNRTFDLTTPVSVQSKKYILDHFLPDYESYDVLIGYRADDAYFSFSRAFLSNGISLEQLRRAMELGKLGEQIVVKSPEAFRRLTFVQAIPAIGTTYYPRRQSRDTHARQAYRTLLLEEKTEDMTFVSDLMKGNRPHDDPRI